ncbi:M20/M25/M40 family metallo-hydrolase [Pseudotenacibaculum sp. MALMAid0570]|uniref:M20/M25/M40 family metallo-hydrolase n=1 Tax=Pseudotenacibaculum sp. MALMAid0570 TaxID=3143938 RepID=UPI0032DF0BF9
MKKYTSLISFLIIILGAYWGFYDQKPITVKSPKNETEFSIENALSHLKNISKEVHHVGTPGHKRVQDYLLSELQKLGLSPFVQTQTVINEKWVAGTTVENVLAKIDGKEDGKALLLLSHYDSNPNIAIGASDAGSGVVTILEGIRAFLAKGEQPKNDIIILISDAEELGLLGAKAFVDHHPWASDVGLVLNFEARGSGGPSYMLMETNGKNSKMISEFIKANSGYPVSNSLLYSIYKKLPNDTDLTVFRENGNINGFNFAFIGDHFDYHTMQDTFERLDRTTLAHQADYITNTLNYFANSNLNNLNSDVDDVYVNFPILKMLSYPFAWVNTMLIIAAVLLLVLVYFGIVLNKLVLKEILKGFIPSVLSILVCGGVSYVLWMVITSIHCGYADILHGFTYNGYWYIIAFACLNVWLLFWVYKYFTKKENVTSLFIAPITVWLIINFIIPEDFKGAGFLIIPVLIAEIILAISIFTNSQKISRPILFAFLSIPSVYILAPLVKMFPVGLGLKILYVSGIVIALLFGLLIPVINASKSRRAFSKLAGVLAIIFFSIATYYSGFTSTKKKPNSLVYIQNVADSTAFWGTYNQVLDPFINQKLGDNPTKGGIVTANTKSKYNTRFSYHKKADYVTVPTAEVIIESDTVINQSRIVDLVIKPKRKIRKLELVTKERIVFQKLVANTILINKGNEYRSRGSFLIYHFGNQDTELRLQMTLGLEEIPEIIINEISDDLLSNSDFTIQPRSEEMMPMPFVTNDAIISALQLKL